MSHAQTITFLLNGKAGTCDVGTATTLIEKLGAEHGVDVEVIAFDPGSDLTAMAKEAVESGSSIVAAGGGDGTISAVAAALVGTDTALGVLPLGTLNHFAKDLGIPLKLEDAVRALLTGETIAVDVAEINGKVFLNNSSLGLYPPHRPAARGAPEARPAEMGRVPARPVLRRAKPFLPLSALEGR